MFTIDLEKIFALPSLQLELVMAKPPVSRGGYSMEFSKDARARFGIGKDIEGRAIATKIAIAISEQGVIGYISEHAEIYGTKTISITKTGKVTNEAIHTMLTNHFGIDWNLCEEFPLIITCADNLPSAFVLTAKNPMTTAELDARMAEELQQVQEVIDVAEALNAEQQIEVATDSEVVAE